MTMTSGELIHDLSEQLENGVDPETPVLLALQEHYPLISTIRAITPVFPVGDEDEQGKCEVLWGEPCTHLLLAEGSQRSEWNAGETGASPYTTPAEDAALVSIGWGSGR